MDEDHEEFQLVVPTEARKLLQLAQFALDTGLKDEGIRILDKALLIIYGVKDWSELPDYMQPHDYEWPDKKRT